MHTARRLVLLALAASVVSAVMAGPTWATTAITVTDASGKNCPSIPNGCARHAEGEVTLYFHIFGIESTEGKCHVEGRAQVDSAGTEQVASGTVTPGKHDADCSSATSPPCSGSLPWTGQMEKDADGVVRTHFDICMAPAERSSSSCSGEFVVNVSEAGGAGAEVQTMTATDLRIGASSFCELDVSQTSEVMAPEGQAVHIKGN
jgi:hypothetical protein